MKTQLTRQLEQYIENTYLLGKIGVFGCDEVKIGIGFNNETEIVDYLIYDRSANEFKCYEIKSSLSDMRSKSKLSFVGHKNYLVTTREVYEQALKRNLIPMQCGVILFNEGVIKRSSKKTLGMNEQIMLLESLMRSLFYKNQKLKGLR